MKAREACKDKIVPGKTEVSHCAESRFFPEYLRENEFLSKTIVDCLSGTQMGSIHEKKIAKNPVTLPL